MDYIGISLAMQGVTSLAIFALAFSLTQNLEVTLALMSLALLVIGLVYDMPRSNGFEKLRLGITWRKTRHLLLKCLPIVIGALAMAAAVSAPRQYLFDAMGEAALGVYASVAAPGGYHTDWRILHLLSADRVFRRLLRSGREAEAHGALAASYGGYCPCRHCLRRAA